MRVAGVVLAAGHGERLGGDVPKPLALLGGTPLVRHALDAICATDLSPIVLVVGRHGGEVAAAAPAGVMVVHAPRWHDGIAHSLHAALDAVVPYAEVSAVCVGLADQPLVGTESYQRLVAAHETGATLAVATYGGHAATRSWSRARSGTRPARSPATKALGRSCRRTTSSRWTARARGRPTMSIPSTTFARSSSA